MALYTMVIYPLSDFTTLNFGTSGSGGTIVTGAVLNPITIVVDDDDTQLNNSDPTPATINSAPGGSGINPGDTLIYNATVTNELTTSAAQNFVQITINGAPYIAYYHAGIPLQPNTTYNEVIPAVILTSSNYSNWGPICFANGTLIETGAGERPVEHLQTGDLVKASDGRLVPIRWIGAREFNAGELRRNDRLWPVRIPAHALARGMPRADLVVSQQHRILVRSEIAQRMFGAAEILLPAKRLLRLEGVALLRDIDRVVYHHFLCDRHEVVISNGAFTESLYPGPEAMKAVGPEYRREILDIFPELLRGDHRPGYARPVPRKGRKLEQFVFRHIRNGKALYRLTA